MRLPSSLRPLLRALAAPSLFTLVLLPLTLAQESPQKPTEKTAAKDSASTEPKNPAQIELLETKVRFESNGDSRKEVHTRVRINSELGVRQFARLNFDYNRSFQSIEIPLVRITHPSGGTADILPSAITDNPNPAVINAPAYQDVRVKSVRILGLAPDDTLEYRIITTTTHHPLAPDFWLDHSFDRTGVVSEEIFEVDLPASRKFQLHVQPEFTYEIIESENRTDAHSTYRWKHSFATDVTATKEPLENESDVTITTFESWFKLSMRLGELLGAPPDVSTELTNISAEIAHGLEAPAQKVEAIYDYVSQKISTINIPLGSTGFRPRSPEEILSSGYGTAEDKFKLFAALSKCSGLGADAVLIGAPESAEKQLPRPSLFTNLLIATGYYMHAFWLDPTIEVAPFQVIPSNLRDRRGLFLNPPISAAADVHFMTWIPGPIGLPFTSKQEVKVDAALDAGGKLTAKVKYVMRGDNELLLRVAFHRAPKEKWKDLAQLLSISDGFRGQVTSVTVSDPYATREPFTLDYEITVPKFVDWTKTPVHIPALLPQLGLPDPPARPAAGAAVSPIELGTPLEVETHMTLHLPPGTTAQTPTGTSVQRDYATYASQYSAKGQSIAASRHINFLLREVPAERSADYNAFLRAVQSDEAQDFTLDRPDAVPGTPAPARSQP